MTLKRSSKLKPRVAGNPRTRLVRPPESVRRRASRKIIMSVGAVTAAILAAVGTNLGNWLSSSISSSDQVGTSPSARTVPSSNALPFAIDVLEDYGDCNAFALPIRLLSGQQYAQLTTTNEFTDDQWSHFLLPLKGAPVGSVSIALTFSGLPDTTARITDVQIKPIGRPADAYSGSYIPLIHQGGGDNPYNFTVDLSKPNPKLEGMAGQQDFPGWQINVNQDLDSTVYVHFTAGTQAYAWDFVIDYDANGINKSTLVTQPGGGPFNLTGPSNTYDEVFQPDGGGYQATGTRAVNRSTAPSSPQ